MGETETETETYAMGRTDEWEGVDACDDDEVVFLGYGTQSKKRKQKPINLITQTQRQSQSQTLRDTFRDISSTLTQTQTQTQSQQSRSHLLSSAAFESVTQRAVQFEDADDWLEDEAWKGESHVPVDRMHLVGGIKFEADKSKAGSFSVRLRDLPFAQGGERNAYHLFIDASASSAGRGGKDEHYVAKESRMDY